MLQQWEINHQKKTTTTTTVETQHPFYLEQFLVVQCNKPNLEHQKLSIPKLFLHISVYYLVVGKLNWQLQLAPWLGLIGPRRTNHSSEPLRAEPLDGFFGNTPCVPNSPREVPTQSSASQGGRSGQPSTCKPSRNGASMCLNRPIYVYRLVSYCFKKIF